MARLHIRHLVRSDGFAGVERYLTYVGPELVRRGHEVSVVGGAPRPMGEALAGTGVRFIPARTVAEVVRAAVADPGAGRPARPHDRGRALGGHRRPAPPVPGRGHPALRRRAGPLGADTAGLPRHRGPTSTPSSPSAGSSPTRPDRASACSPRASPRQPTAVPAPPTAPTLGSCSSPNGWSPRRTPTSPCGPGPSRASAAGLGAAGRRRRDRWSPTCARWPDRLDPSGSIHFVGQRSDLGADLRAASILLAPTPDEAFGLTVVEAMAVGVPVVAAAGGGHLETVGPVGPDLLFAPGDASRGGRRDSATWPTTPTERARIGRALQARFEAEYRIEHHAEQLESVYLEVLEPSPAAAAGDRPASTRPRRRSRRRPAIGRVRLPRLPSRRRCRAGGARAGPSHRRRPRRHLRRRPVRRRGHGRTWATWRSAVGAVRGEPAASRSAGGRPGCSTEQRFDLTVGFGVECPACDVAVVGSVHRAWLDLSGPVHTPFVDLPARTRFAMPRHLALLALERRLLRPHAHPSGPGDIDLHGGGDHPHLRRAQPERIEIMPNGYDPTSSTLGSGPLTACRSAPDSGLADQVVLLFVANELHRKGFSTLIEAVASVGRPAGADRGRRARRPGHLP